jgi:glycerophosphoryl diester phosphodiesterase
MQLLKRLLCLLTALTLLFAAAAPAFAAEATDIAAPARGKLTESGGEIVGIANRGVWDDAPENSLPALLAVADTGLKYALADVSRSEDGVLVLMAADAAKRMLGLDSPYVSDYTLEELRAQPLKKRVGGEGNPDTGLSVDTLAEALPQVKAAGVTPVLKCDASLADELAAEPEAAGCVLYFTGKTKAVTAAVQKYAGAFEVLGEKRSNVIFSVLSFVKSLREAGAAGAVLKTTNRYGVIYYKSTLAKCEGLRAVADTSFPDTTGARQDCEKWWDDLISRGYSAIITDDPAGFAEYLRQNDAARSRLREAYEDAKKATLPAFSMLSDYRKLYSDAETQAIALLSDSSASTQEMTDACAALRFALKTVELHFEEIQNGTADKTVTLPRILLCVGAAAAVIAVQIYFYQRRKKA